MVAVRWTSKRINNVFWVSRVCVGTPNLPQKNSIGYKSAGYYVLDAVKSGVFLLCAIWRSLERRFDSARVVFFASDINNFKAI